MTSYPIATTCQMFVNVLEDFFSSSCSVKVSSVTLMPSGDIHNRPFLLSSFSSSMFAVAMVMNETRDVYNKTHSRPSFSSSIHSYRFQ